MRAMKRVHSQSLETRKLLPHEIPSCILKEMRAIGTVHRFKRPHLEILKFILLTIEKFTDCLLSTKKIRFVKTTDSFESSKETTRKGQTSTGECLLMLMTRSIACCKRRCKSPSSQGRRQLARLHLLTQ